MRDRLVYALLSSALLACGGGGMSADGGGDDAPPPPPDAGDPPPPTRGFQLVSPDVMIEPGQEITYCYYFRTPNTESMAIKKWTSSMTPGSHHLILFTTGNTDKRPPGTISAANCGFGGDTALPAWTYSAQTPTAELALPADDGTGTPLAIDIPANTAGFIQMHYFNSTDQVINAHVTINAEALPAGAAFTKTAAYVTYNGDLSIPPSPNPQTLDVETQSCDVPAGAKFWLMSTHAHKQAVKTEVLDGATMAMESTDWEHPIPATWMASPFFAFASGKVTYRCTYYNPTDRTITSGDSAATDEMCMASGYYFPATKSRICFDGFLLP